MKKTKMLTEGALLAAVFGIFVLVLSYVPLIGPVAIFFLILPFLIFCSKYPLKYLIVFSAACLFISMLAGTTALLPFALLYGGTGFVMGYCIQLKKSKLFIYLASSLTFLAGLIIGLFVSIKFFHLNIINENLKQLRESVNQSRTMLEQFGQQSSIENLNKMADSMVSLYQIYLPSFLLLFSFLAVFVLMAVNFPVAKRLGVPVPKWSPYREFRLPKSVLWYYVICLVLSMFIETDASSFLSKAVMNLLLIFEILVLMQGFSLINFYSYEKKWPKVFFVMAVIFAIIFSPLLYLVMILGIIDIGFDFRRYIRK
ncbi:YybS family protein [Heyndrickxia acidiproducens]|uniref:YybS family protein n=1 Tax=Heyndrickxia acidiproducens TaxID=1121084 RepID=UPI0012DC6C6C|nr:YybS family protein [Heyndrickxia acidiproducens]